MDWGAWSREAVAETNGKSEKLRAMVGANARYDWDEEEGRFFLTDDEGQVVAAFQKVCTHDHASDTVLWSWANPSIPKQQSHQIEAVKAFGEENDLALLFEPQCGGGHAQALEIMAIACRVLEADAAFIAPGELGTVYFLLFAPTRVASPPE
jgi:hypothetical protein